MISASGGREHATGRPVPRRLKITPHTLHLTSYICIRLYAALKGRLSQRGALSVPVHTRLHATKVRDALVGV
eukprot:scaffold7320_cov54-Phaeocystis_antarctica.AAC.1